ncbi:MAG: hypothetical protein ABSG00_02785 [Terracidiphilus sp.]|jgi:hypothetical protein
MNRAQTILVLLFLALAARLAAQDDPAPERRSDFRYSLSVIDDATFDTSLRPPLPASATMLTDPSVTLLQNQLLVEPSFTLRYRSRWSVASSVVGLADSFHGLSAADFDLPPDNAAASAALNAAIEPSTGTHTQFRVKEAYAGLSAGDFDFMAGRRIVRWGTGYAFTPAGVLDPPRDPTNPTDRLNLNQGRDMVKADYVHGPHALSLVWSSAALAPANANLHDTTAFRYNVLVHGFDTSLIAAYERGGDAVGGLTFTRVFGVAWEVHGEAAWREQGAVLLGAKYTTTNGVSFIGEFYTPPNTAYYRDMNVSPTAGRQHYVFFTAYKNRLRELPGWKQWDLSASMVENLNDRSNVFILDANRRFGNHFSSYLHMEVPEGAKATDYGATPYTTATSLGVRFQL